MEHSLHDILEACKFLSPNINSYFEDKLYLQDVEHPEEITSIFKVKLAISLVLQELEEIGIITNLDEEEILGFQYYTKMVLALRKKFDKENLFNEIMSLDETDSGLDVDALRIVANGVNALHTPEKAAIVITHYQRLLDYIVPDVVHVLKDGRIVKTAGKELVAEIEETGYDNM